MDEPAETRLAVHEAVCAERYINITARMTKIEYLLYAVIITVLLGPGTAGEFIKKLIGI
jgi:hypothetical protein